MKNSTLLSVAAVFRSIAGEKLKVEPWSLALTLRKHMRAISGAVEPIEETLNEVAETYALTAKKEPRRITPDEATAFQEGGSVPKPGAFPWRGYWMDPRKADEHTSAVQEIMDATSDVELPDPLPAEDVGEALELSLATLDVMLEAGVLAE